MNKIKNWIKNHEYVCGFGLLFVSLCSLAFGGAYFGANAALNNTTVNVNLCCQEDGAEFTAE